MSADRNRGTRGGLPPFKYYRGLKCGLIIQVGAMEDDIKNENPKNGRKPRKRVKLDQNEPRLPLKNQNIDDDPSQRASHESDSSSGWSNEVIEPAIKSMNFRKKRGTRMKQLIRGKHRKDQFWEKYQNYFGGDLDKPEDEEDQEDYEASSSGRDEFDSDFDLTDSYVGKRGRKKGTKVKRKKKPVPKAEGDLPEAEPKPKGKRGRKKKVPLPPPPQQEPGILLKEEKGENSPMEHPFADFLAQQNSPRSQPQDHELPISPEPDQRSNQELRPDKAELEEQEGAEAEERREGEVEEAGREEIAEGGGLDVPL